MEWPTIVIVVLTGVFTLAGALGGPWMAGKRQSDRDDAALRAREREELREILAEVITDARDFVDLEWLLIPMFAKFEATDAVEFADTDSGKKIAAIRARLTRSTTRARLIVDPGSDLGGALSDFSVLHRHFTEQAHGPVMNTRKSQTERFDGVSEGYKYLRIVSSKVDDIEDLSVRALSAFK